jgi:hypothetical protein
MGQLQVRSTVAVESVRLLRTEVVGWDHSAWPERLLARRAGGSTPEADHAAERAPTPTLLLPLNLSALSELVGP